MEGICLLYIWESLQKHLQAFSISVVTENCLDIRGRGVMHLMELVHSSKSHQCSKTWLSVKGAIDIFFKALKSLECYRGQLRYCGQSFIGFFLLVRDLGAKKTNLT